jgi:UDP-GlcNAc:undecaprenyl-phosphate/decaprenyl-phosphate GlcNAc-1-phosphate transferase
MMDLWLLFGLTAALCALLTPVFRDIAIKCGLVDHPDGARKTHVGPIPLAGGLAVFASSVSALLLIRLLGWSFETAKEENWTFLLGLLAASTFICVLGVIDDSVMLRGRYKLAGQLISVVILICSGVIVRNLNLFGYELELGIMAAPFTALWLLGAINSLNLIDGMDGLLSSIGLVICLTLGVMALLSGQLTAACLAITLAGALAGFLCYNFPPASVFLGDAGSMLIGLVVGVLAIQSALKGPATVALSLPMAVLAIPFFDTLAAIARRKLTGRSIYIADREHLHHCLQRRGFSSRRVLFCVSCFCLLTAAGGMVSVILKNETYAIITTVLTITMMIVTRMFGYSEFLLVKKHLVVLASSLLTHRMKPNHHSMEVHLNGSADWQALWLKLVEAADENELNALVLDVSASAGLERYHARWTRVKAAPETMDLWKTVIPLSLRGSVVGRLHVMGQRSSRPIGKQMILLADLIDDLEAGLPALLPPLDSYAAVNEFPVSDEREEPEAIPEMGTSI